MVRPSSSPIRVALWPGVLGIPDAAEYMDSLVIAAVVVVVVVRTL